MRDTPLDPFTVTLCWLWSLAVAARDELRAVKWQGATMRALGQDYDETAILDELDARSAQ